MTLAHVPDITAEEHGERKVRTALALVPEPPDSKLTVMAEFDKGHDMSRKDVAAALRSLPQFTGKADSTVDGAAKSIISRLEGEGAIHQTQKPARGRPALYRKAAVGTASA